MFKSEHNVVFKYGSAYWALQLINGFLNSISQLLIKQFLTLSIGTQFQQNLNLTHSQIVKLQKL